MRSGIEKSGALLLFLSKGVLRRPFVQFEIRTAKELGKQIILVHESDKRHAPFDFVQDRSDAPSDLLHLLDDYEVRC